MKRCHWRYTSSLAHQSATVFKHQCNNSKSPAPLDTVWKNVLLHALSAPISGTKAKSSVQRKTMLPYADFCTYRRWKNTQTDTEPSFQTPNLVQTTVAGNGEQAMWHYYCQWYGCRRYDRCDTLKKQQHQWGRKLCKSTENKCKYRETFADRLFMHLFTNCAKEQQTTATTATTTPSIVIKRFVSDVTAALFCLKSQHYIRNLLITTRKKLHYRLYRLRIKDSQQIKRTKKKNTDQRRYVVIALVAMNLSTSCDNLCVCVCVCVFLKSKIICAIRISLCTKKSHVTPKKKKRSRKDTHQPNECKTYLL